MRFIFSVSYFCLQPVDLNFSAHGLTQFQFTRGFSLLASQRFGPVEISTCSLAILISCAILSPLSSAVTSAGRSVISSPPAAASTGRRLFSVRSSPVCSSSISRLPASAPPEIPKLEFSA
jgi:hypothetical protein